MADGRRVRQRVLIVVDALGYIEAFADRNIDVRIERLCRATTREGSIMAEEILAMTLPRSYRELYSPSKRRRSGIASPLYPSVKQKSIHVQKAVDSLNWLRGKLPVREEPSNKEV